MTPPLNKILYAEDERRIQFVTKMALERIGGFTVAICASGAETLRVAPEFQPDLFLLDVRMPGMSGPEVLEALRQLPGLEKTPSVFMTANVMKEDIERYKGTSKNSPFSGVVDLESGCRFVDSGRRG